MQIMHIVGARPNFMKLAPVWRALQQRPAVQQSIVHTGQHYDANMSDVFFEEMGLPKPDVNLEVGSGSHAAQTGLVMMRFEEIVMKRSVDLVVVYGDVNSTVAASLVCAKLGIRVAHVEAGLRSRDRTMPEEINRLVTDQLADLLFTPSQDGDANLIQEGIGAEKIHFVGNVMIDTLMRLLPRAEETAIFQNLGIEKKNYIAVTLHRPSNVDDDRYLGSVLESLTRIAKRCPVVFPIHPRTRQRLKDKNLLEQSGIRWLEPVGYLDFLALQKYARAVITDSGGIQEETTYLGVPCITVRENTERPVTVTLGTNVLVGRDMIKLEAELENVFSGKAKKGQIPPLWDGHAGDRIADVIIG